MNWPSSASTTASSPCSALSSMPRRLPMAGMPKARARMAAWPAGLASSIATPAMPRACQSSSSAGPSRRASRIAPFGHRRTRGLAGQRGQQPVGEILHVGEAFAQIGVADPPHPVMQLAGDTLHRGLGRHAAADDVADAAQPAGIGRHQPIRLQHLARRGHVGRAPIVRHVGEQVVQAALHAVHRLVQPRLLRLRIIREQPDDRAGGAQQHDRPDGDPRPSAGCR